MSVRIDLVVPRSYFSPQCEYLGLDPYAGHGEFRIIGLGEILPIRDQSVDVVVF